MTHATTPNIEKARVFPSHRALVAAVVELQKEGEIDGYSIKAVTGGYVAGVRKNFAIGGFTWAWLV